MIRLLVKYTGGLVNVSEAGEQFFFLIFCVSVNNSHPLSCPKKKKKKVQKHTSLPGKKYCRAKSGVSDKIGAEQEAIKIRWITLGGGVERGGGEVGRVRHIVVINLFRQFYACYTTTN